MNTPNKIILTIKTEKWRDAWRTREWNIDFSAFAFTSPPPKKVEENFKKFNRIILDVEDVHFEIISGDSRISGGLSTGVYGKYDATALSLFEVGRLLETILKEAFGKGNLRILLFIEQASVKDIPLKLRFFNKGIYEVETFLEKKEDELNNFSLGK